MIAYFTLVALDSFLSLLLRAISALLPNTTTLPTISFETLTLLIAGHVWLHSTTASSRKGVEETLSNSSTVNAGKLSSTFGDSGSSSATESIAFTDRVSATTATSRAFSDEKLMLAISNGSLGWTR